MQVEICAFKCRDAARRLGCLFFMLLYLSMMALGSLPVWRQEGLLFHRCASPFRTDILPMRECNLCYLRVSSSPATELKTARWATQMLHTDRHLRCDARSQIGAEASRYANEASPDSAQTGEPCYAMLVVSTWQNWRACLPVRAALSSLFAMRLLTQEVGGA